MKNGLIRILVIGFAFLALGCKKDPPNIIFFIADDMYPEMFINSPNNTDENGQPIYYTPTLDSLVKEGVWIVNMKVASPVCTPSRYNCLTGNYASRAVNKGFINSTNENDGQPVIQWNTFIVPGEQNTMGSYFQNLGYKTGFVGKNHVIQSMGQRNTAKLKLDADLKDLEVKKELKLRYEKLQNDIMECGFDYADGLYHDNPDWLGIKALASHNMDWITEKGLEFIDRQKDEPFLLYMASTIPHAPVNATNSWQADRRITPAGVLNDPPMVHPYYVDKWIPPDDKDNIDKDPGLEATIRNVMSIKRRIQKNGAQGKYKENVLWLDDAVGALMKKLEEDELLDNTIIVFFNDHGQEQKGTLYEGGINSQAFIWKKGGFKVGNKLNVPISNVDFLPTLLDLAGAKRNLDSFDGFSFKDALDDNRYEERTFTYHELGYARAIVKDGFKYYSIRYPKWAMDLSLEERKTMLDEYNEFKRINGRPIVSTDPQSPFGHLVMIPGGELAENPAFTTMPHFSDPDQFYDLKNDPGELNNLIDNPNYADKIAELKEQLRQELDNLPGNFGI